MTTLSNPSLNLAHPDVFAQHKADFGLDIDWLSELKQSAWQRFLELPTPVRTDEKWRFANIAPLKELANFAPAPIQAIDAPAIAEASHRLDSVAGRLVFVDDNLLGTPFLNPELADQGVIFTTLLDAIVRFPDKVRAVFMQQSPELGSEKFEALHLAFLRNGTFLYIPDNVEVAAPFVVYNWAQSPDCASFPHTLFVTGKHAKASLIEFQECATPDSAHLVIANSHLYADAGSQPSHTILQNWNAHTLSFQLNTSNAQADTNTKSVVVNLGSQQARQEIHGKIFGRGANVELYSLNVPTGTQQFDQRTLQSHIAPNSRSDLLFKNALLDQSRTIFSGLIIVEENAQQTDAYQTNNNLMLSEDAEANSLPGLEIGANDVKCSHGATTGRIDDSELFYFLARGIPRNEAQALRVFGFFEEIIAKIDDAPLADFIRDRVQAKFRHR